MTELKKILKEKTAALMWLMVLSAVSSAVEIGMLATIGPSILIIFNKKEAMAYINKFDITEIFNGTRNTEEVITLVLVLLVVLIILSGFLRYYVLAAQTRFAQEVGENISKKMLKKLFEAKYESFDKYEKSLLVSSVTNKTQVLTNRVILQYVFLLNSLIVVAAITMGMTVINAEITAMVLGGLTITYILMWKILRKKLTYQSQKMAKSITGLTKYTMEFIDLQKILRLSGNPGQIYGKFSASAKEYAESQRVVQVLTAAPRYLVETVTFLVIISTAIAMEAKENDGSTVIYLSMLLLAAQRIMPQIQQIYASFTTIRGNRACLTDITKILELKPRRKASESLKNRCKPDGHDNIKFKNVSFSYQDENKIINGISFTIKKGEKIGIIGRSGSGKTTLLNLLMGFYKPVRGEITYNGVNIRENLDKWMRKIALLEQNVLLISGTIAENVCLQDNRDMNEEQVRKAISAAGMKRFIEDIPEGIHYNIEEDGGNLSGGQKQRIALARALYLNKEIIVLDEFTSALDEETELTILKNIRNLESTVIIVSHNKIVQQYCDRMIDMSEFQQYE